MKQDCVRLAPLKGVKKTPADLRMSDIQSDNQSDFIENITSRFSGATLITAVTLFSLAIYLLFISASGPMLLLSTGDKVHKKCIAALSKSKNKQKDDFGALFMAGIAGGICDALRDECNTNPSSGACSMMSKKLR